MPQCNQPTCRGVASVCRECVQSEMSERAEVIAQLRDELAAARDETEHQRERAEAMWKTVAGRVDENERLRADLAAARERERGLREALEPFAKVAQAIEPMDRSDGYKLNSWCSSNGVASITAGDVRRARSALAATGGKP